MHKRRSRMSRQLAISKTRERPKSVVVTPRLISTCRLLSRYRYLPSNFITEFDSQSHQVLIRRLRDWHDAEYLNRPERQKFTINFPAKSLVYELGRRGKDLLHGLGFAPEHRLGYGRNFFHELMVCTVIASIELSARKHGVSVTFPEKDLYPIPVGSTSLFPDGLPVTLGLDQRSLHIIGIELDRATEPLTGDDRSTIESKFKGYIDLASSKGFKSHLGFPHMLVPFITTSEERKDNMMRLLAQQTGGKCSFILFRVEPDFAAHEGNLPPSLSILTDQWERVGYPPLTFLDELKK